MKALVLSGGGARGAWQVGALKYLYVDEGNKYDIISGVSVGALNGAFLSQYDKGSGIQAYAELENLWLELSNNKIYRKWYYGILGTIPAAWKPSIYTTKPLRKLIKDNIDPSKYTERLFSLGAVRRDTGEYKFWHSAEDDFERNLYDYILASSAVPGYFPPHKIGSSLYLDGGIRELSPVRDAIFLGAKEIDVLIPSSRIGSNTPNRALRTVMRAVSIMIQEIEVNDVYIPRLKDISLRVLRPSSKISGESLDFSKNQIKLNIRKGYHDAVVSWEKVLDTTA